MKYESSQTDGRMDSRDLQILCLFCEFHAENSQQTTLSCVERLSENQDGGSTRETFAVVFKLLLYIKSKSFGL
jgi:hypothetical protein